MATQTSTTIPHRDITDWVPLNAWNQVAPRSYNRFLLCFEVENKKQVAAVAHLTSCARKLGENRPVLKSLLKANVPVALISKLGSHDIPVEVYDIKDTFGQRYSHLKEAGFPASAFLGKGFEVPTGHVDHALILRIYNIDGGLLLGIHLHHSVGDGKAVDAVISWLSAESRGASSDDPEPVIFASSFEERRTDDQTLDPEDISQRFPERKLLGTPPAQTPANDKRIGKILVFKMATIETIQNQATQLGNMERPSTVVTLIALLWVHTVKARTVLSQAMKNGEHRSRLLTIVDARRRVLNHNQAREYFGNMAEAALTNLPTAQLLQAGEAPTSETHSSTAAKQLEPVFRSLHDSIQEVDEVFIRERHSLYTRLPDPRNLMIDYSMNDKRVLMFNSWRYIGMNPGQEWNLIGTDSVVYPDAIRRAGDEWNGQSVMVLPARPESGELEAMVVIEEDAMERLLGDQALMELVYRVIG
ncbi:transferase family-domain-containing protein [Nemania sp. NC0429]|nr:transferase family-domain-containing protein [Nemania sp. NC0429]